MNKTNIIVSIGSATNTKEIIKQFIINGTRVFRINLNYYDYSFCEDVINKIRNVDQELGTFTSIMLDTVGPDLKTGKFLNKKAYFNEGFKIRIYSSEIVGDETKFSINYNKLVENIEHEKIEIYDKAIDLLNAFLETGNWKVLPSDNVPLSSYGSFSLSSNIANIRNYF